MSARVGLEISLIPDGDGVKAMINGTRVDLENLGKSSKNLDWSRQLSASKRGITAIGQQLKTIHTQVLAIATASFVGGGVSNLVSMADAARESSARLKLATDGVREYTQASEALFEISQRNYTAYSANVELFARLAPTFRDLGRSQEELLNVTELVSQSMRLSGATTAEAQGAIRQFAQALGSGVLRGDEFNSVNEQGGRLMQALADGLGVARSELRAMANAGQLTTDKVLAALASQTQVINDEMAQLPLTVGAATQTLKNAFQRQVGAMDEATGATATISAAIAGLANNLDAVLVVAVGAAAAGMTYFAQQAGVAALGAAKASVEKLKDAQASRASAVAAYESARALVAQAQAAQAAATGFSRLAATEKLLAARHQLVAVGAATATARMGAFAVASRALGAFLAGPWGLAIMAGATAAMALWGDSAEAAAKDTAALKTETEGLGQAMKSLAETDVVEQMAAISAEINRRRAAIDNYRKGLNGLGGQVGGEQQRALLIKMIEQEEAAVSSLEQQLGNLGQARSDEVAKAVMMMETAEQYGQRMYEFARQAYPEATETAEEYGQRMAAVARQQLAAMETAEQYGQRMYELARQAWPEATESAEEYGQRMAELARQQLAAMAEQERQQQAAKAATAEQYQQLQESLYSEEEQIAASWSRRAQITGQAYQDGIIGRREMLNTMAALEAEAAKKQEDLDRARFKAQLAVASDMTANMATLMQSDSKKQFEIGKKFALANAIIKGIEAVQSAYASGTAIGGPILGAAYAATAAVATAANVKAIQSQTFGSSSMGGATVPGGTLPEVPSSLADTQPASQPATQSNVVQVFVTGNTVMGEADMEELVVNALQSASSDRDVQLLDPNGADYQMIRTNIINDLQGAA